jgi:hypothetical protein
VSPGLQAFWFQALVSQWLFQVLLIFDPGFQGPRSQGSHLCLCSFVSRFRVSGFQAPGPRFQASVCCSQASRPGYDLCSGSRPVWCSEPFVPGAPGSRPQGSRLCAPGSQGSPGFLLSPCSRFSSRPRISLVPGSALPLSLHSCA